MRVSVIDVGGTHVKILAAGERKKTRVRLRPDADCQANGDRGRATCRTTIREADTSYREIWAGGWGVLPIRYLMRTEKSELRGGICSGSGSTFRRLQDWMKCEA